MVVANMDGPTRDQVLRYMEEKDRIEQEIQELNLVLETNKVGMDDTLVDADGFPRNDVDVYQVRHARHRIICLQNDHKAIMKQIEKGLYALHAKTLGTAVGDSSHESGTAAYATNDSTPMDTSSDHSLYRGSEEPVASVVFATNSLRMDEKPIAKVNFVSPGSPAETAGIKVDDEILQFGSINSSNYSSLTQIAEVVQRSVNQRVDVKLRRDSQVLNVALVPMSWSGRGLLGCNIIPV